MSISQLGKATGRGDCHLSFKVPVFKCLNPLLKGALPSGAVVTFKTQSTVPAAAPALSWSGFLFNLCEQRREPESAVLEMVLNFWLGPGAPGRRRDM